MSTDTASQVLPTVECSFCFHVMRAPIYQCNIGHSICSNCKDSLVQCPTCQDDTDLVRNYALESMLPLLLDQPCPFAKYGCQIKQAAIDIEKHQKICAYHDYLCPFCSTYPIWQGTSNELRQHLISSHDEFQLLKNEDQEHLFSIPNCNCAKFRFLVIKNTLFYFYQIESGGETLNQYCVEYVGNKGNAQNFAYKITISSKESPRYRRIEYMEFCSNHLLPFKVPRSLLDSYMKPAMSLEMIEVKEHKH